MSVPESTIPFITVSGRRLPDSNTSLWEQLYSTWEANERVRSLHHDVVHESVSYRKKVKKNLKQVRSTAQQLEKQSREKHHPVKSLPPESETTSAIEAEQLAHDMLLHDIRSPIGKVSGLVQLMKTQCSLSDQLRHLVDLVEEQSEKALKLTHLHSIYQQLESGRYQPQPEPFDLLELLGRIQRNLSGKASVPTIEMRVDGKLTDSASRCLLSADALLMELMLQNLVQNAVEASPPDGVVQIEVSSLLQTDDLEPSTQGPLGSMKIAIHNAGMIPAAIQDRFFEKFATCGKSRGTGLGTYIAQLVARSCGGTISFTTSRQQGTTLCVHLQDN